MLECTLQCSSVILLYAVIGAPILSGPYSGKPCTCLPELNATSASSRHAVLAPWPPLPCHLISTASFNRFVIFYLLLCFILCKPCGSSLSAQKISKSFSMPCIDYIMRGFLSIAFGNFLVFPHKKFFVNLWWFTIFAVLFLLIL